MFLRDRWHRVSAMCKKKRVEKHWEVSALHLVPSVSVPWQLVGT